MIWKELIEKAKNIEDLIQIKKNHFDEQCKLLCQKLADAKESQDKKSIGQELNQFKNSFLQAFDEMKVLLTEKKNNEKIDISLHNHNLGYFSTNYLSAIKEEIISFFKNASFEIQFGDEVVDVENNFDQLLIDKSHPSRSMSETFYFNEEKLLRTHCTSNSVIQLVKQKDKNIPYKLITMGPVYRKDDSDNRHTEQFTQVDIVWVEKDLNLGTLKWFITSLFQHIFGEKTIFRFRNSFFPFTQPSFEVDMKCKCNSAALCSICGGSGWIEIMGCGMLHKTILTNSGYSDDFEAIAGGIGVERLVLIKYQLTDIRNLYKNNFQTLKHDC